MHYRNRCGKINVKLIIILVLVTVALGVSLVAARQVRRSILSKMSLTAGEAAFQKQDWPAAVKNYQEYLGRNPDDLEILKKYAKALLSVRPLEGPAIARAIAAYRRILQLAPRDDLACDKLALLYAGIGNWEELAYIARMRLSHDPNDPNNLQAPLWLADALVRLNKAPEAQQGLEQFTKRLEMLPDKHAEYVRACGIMSQIVLAGNSSAARAEALDWLNKAVASGADPARALAQRAQFYRRAARDNEATKATLTTSAQDDLKAADAAGTDDPTVLCFLGAEWIEHGELDRATQELQALDKLPQEKLEEQSLDLDTWKVRRFLFASQLALRRGATVEGAALADETLDALKGSRYRIQVLPAAIPLYIAAGQASKARACLNEYLGARHTKEEAAESREKLAYLQALVARAEGNWYAVIDRLQPAVVGDTSPPELWHLLAEAYSMTDQSRRAVSALTSYLRYRPGDPQMTLQLAREYLRLRNWNRALETARLAEPLDPADYLARLLRIEAGVHTAAEQQQKPTAATFSGFSKELTQLRGDHPEDVDIRILQAIIADYLEEPDRAETELKLAIEQCKEPLKAEMQLAKHYLRVKRVDEATRVCRDACDRHSGVAEPWLALASLHTAKEEYNAASDCLRKGLDAATGKWEKRSLSIQLALLELTHGKDRTAGIKRLSDLAAQDPQEIRVRSLLLNTREIQQDQTRAQGLIDELKKAEGENGIWWRIHQAALWLSSPDWRSKQRDITESLQTCMNLDPEWPTPSLLLADMYERLNDWPRVEGTCKQALLRNPAATEIADRLVTLFERQKRFSDAEQILQQIEANSAWRSGRRALNALRAGDFSRAVEELKVRASNDERDANSRILLARLIYWQMGDAAGALRYIKEAEAITPGSLALIGVKAAILRADGQTAEARKILDDYMEGHKDFAAYFMRASYLASEGQLERAEEDFKKLISFPESAVTGYQLLSNFYVNTKRLDKAVATLEEGSKAYPTDLRLQRGLMRLLLSRAQGPDREKAMEILASLAKQLPEDPELMKLRAMLILESPTAESLKTARATLENVVRLAPTAVDAHLALISLATQSGEYPAARDYAIRALGYNANDKALLSARARAELALENPQVAVELAHLVLRQDPNNAEAMEVILQTALTKQERGLLREARPLFEEVRSLTEAAVGRTPKNENLLLVQARVLTSLEQPQKAIPVLEAYCQTKEGAGSVTARVTLADLYRLAGNADQSKQWIDQAQGLDPRHQAVIHARLLWLVSQKRFDELKGISSTYLSAPKLDPTMLLRAAWVLVSLERAELKQEGLKLLEGAAALSPTSINVQQGLASTLYQTGDVTRAKKLYEDLLKQYPDDKRVLNDLAWILQEHDHSYDAALALANQGLKRAPDDLNLLDTRGTILANLPERLADAKSDFARLVELSPPDSQRRAKALLQLGRVCAKLKDLPQAKQHLEEALKIDKKINAFTPGERAEIAEITSKSGV
jgi:tetratricopeptide (TPR) repeat protein